MNTRLISLVWSLVLLGTASVFAQSTLKGKIVNQEGEALPGILVNIEGSYIATYSNVVGEFQLKNLPMQKLVLVLSGIGYETLKDSIVFSGSAIEKKFELKAAVYLSDEVIIKATRVNAKSPTTFSTVTKEDLKAANFGQDIPFILDGTPSTVVSSDAGAGVGYTNMSIRGVDGTRTNVTINGIPVNDAESHGTYWVNMPDFASSAENIQIQRGVGTSTNGAAAFGASININTNELQDSAYAEIANSYGSFNTWKHTVKGGTGLLKNKFTLDTRLSKISSDGYIDRATADLKSFYLSGAYYGKKSTVRANVFSGKEVTYQAWYGTPEAVVKGNQAEIDSFIVRNYVTGKDSANLKDAGRTYNFYTYDREVDDYQQDHYQVHFSHEFSKKLNFNISGHYTRGQGYYEQYRKNEDFSVYNLSPVIHGTDTITTTDLIRRRWLDNHFYGTVYSLNYTNLKAFNLSFGGSANNYEGHHFGEIIWARYASDSEIRDPYYDNNAQKMDISNYLKATYQYKKLNVFADMQFRHIEYTFEGWNTVNGISFITDRQVNFNFFCPKGGLVYDVDGKSSAYTSLSIGRREPVRDDFVGSTPNSQPRPEAVHDFELGYRFKGNQFLFNGNFYFMNYYDQLVLTGKINDVGAYTRTNIDKSYRTGIELEIAYKVLPYLTLKANATFSQSRIIEFKEFIDNYDTGIQDSVIHKNTSIAFSPNIIAGGNITYEPFKNFALSILPKFVGSQFLDNTSNVNKMIDQYFVVNARAQYTVKNWLFKEMSFGLLVNNIANTMYQNNGYTFSYVAGGRNISENFYYPQAGTNFLCNWVCKF